MQGYLDGYLSRFELQPSSQPTSFSTTQEKDDISREEEGWTVMEAVIFVLLLCAALGAAMVASAS